MLFKKIKFYNSLAFRLGLTVFLCMTVIVTGIFSYQGRQIQKIAKNSVSNLVHVLNESTANQISAILTVFENSAESLKRSVEHCAVEHCDRNSEEIYWDIRNLLMLDPNLFYGSSVSFEPGTYHGTNMSFYSYWQNTQSAAEKGKDFSLSNTPLLVETNLNSPDYAYFSQPWYTEAAEKLVPVWSEPYFDEGGGNTLMCTYTIPFFNEDNSFAGVVTADMGLEAFQSIITHLSALQEGFAALVTDTGQVLITPDGKKLLDDSIVTDLTDKEDLRKIQEIIDSGVVGFVDNVKLSGQPVWLYRTMIEKSGWSVLFIVSEKDMLKDLDLMRKVGFHVFIVGNILLLLAVLWISYNFTRPISSLADETMMIAKGNLDKPIQKKTRRNEIGFLSDAIEDMRVNLKSYITSLGETLAAKERITSELKIATSIQKSFLPSDFVIPGFDNIDIHAILEPAKEVGGDLYSFFKMDSHRVFFTVGDVSGKGVPAALFMAVTLTLMKSMQRQKVSSADILKRVGHELSLQNEKTMFVTVFCGILDTDTGILEYSNAGHLPPVWLSKGKEPRWLELPKGIVLGVVKYPVYTNSQVQLEPGDTLIVYTDGVNEAMNEKKELYGEDRLLNFTRGEEEKSVSEITSDICASVHQHAGNEPQSDDITVLALRYKGQPENENAVLKQDEK